MWETEIAIGNNENREEKFVKERAELQYENKAEKIDFNEMIKKITTWKT